MPLIIVIIVLAFAIFTVGPTNIANQIFPPKGAPQVQVSPKSRPPALNQKQEKIQPLGAPNFTLQTFIKYGPLEKEVIDDTNQVTFEFGANVTPAIQSQISFETKIDGFDSDWQQTYSTERSVTLPPGFKQYAFSVRAKVAGFTDKNPVVRNFTIKVSPYFNQARISVIQPPTFYQPSLTTIYAQPSSGNQKLKITGWQLTGKNGIFEIPKGIEKYDPRNPLLTEDIFAQSGNIILISGAEGQQLGINTNFRLNKCFGYLTPALNFTIPIPQNCPRPRLDRLPRDLSDACKQYINSRGSCEGINSDKLNQLGLFQDSACISYLQTNFNYTGCFVNYSQDSDFLTNQWHIYMQKTHNEIMDAVHDTVYLRDQNGLLIDKYKY